MSLEQPYLATDYEMLRWKNEAYIADNYYYTTKQAAKILGVKTQYLRDITCRGRFPGYKIRPYNGNFYLGEEIKNFYKPRKTVDVQNDIKD